MCINVSNFTERHLCFKLDHARSSIRLIQDHDFDINYKTRNRNPDSETRFGFRIKKCAPGDLYDSIPTSLQTSSCICCGILIIFIQCIYLFTKYDIHHDYPVKTMIRNVIIEYT